MKKKNQSRNYFKILKKKISQKIRFSRKKNRELREKFYEVFVTEKTSIEIDLKCERTLLEKVLLDK
jgi:hypothetical protein